MDCCQPVSSPLRAGARRLALIATLAASLTTAPARPAWARTRVPLAADFELASLAQPRVPLALVTARQDRCLIPAFHSDAVLSPLPPGFDRRQLPAVDQRIAGFFNRRLLD